jgi:hypothetical protein
MVSRFVPNVRTPKLLNCGNDFSRACGSSSGTRCATPLCHRPCGLTRTLALALMFLTYCDFSPNSETNQNWSPIRLPPSGVRRGSPDLRPGRLQQSLHGKSAHQRVATRF